MSVDELLDLLDSMTEKAWGLPLTGGRCVMDAEKIRGIIDEIRLNMPQEIRQAKAIVADRSEIIKTAKGEADKVIKTAEEKAKVLVSRDEIVRQAQFQADEILKEARGKAREIKKASADFAEDLIKHTEENLTVALGEVKKARQVLKTPVKLTGQQDTKQNG